MSGAPASGVRSWLVIAWMALGGCVAGGAGAGVRVSVDGRGRATLGLHYDVRFGIGSYAHLGDVAHSAERDFLLGARGVLVLDGRRIVPGLLATVGFLDVGAPRSPDGFEAEAASGVMGMEPTFELSAGRTHLRRELDAAQEGGNGCPVSGDTNRVFDSLEVSLALRLRPSTLAFGIGYSMTAISASAATGICFGGV
jgi:hypothetical protein